MSEIALDAVQLQRPALVPGTELFTSSGAVSDPATRTCTSKASTFYKQPLSGTAYLMSSDRQKVLGAIVPATTGAACGVCPSTADQRDSSGQT